MNSNREGNLEAPTRHPIDWQSDDFYNEDLLNNELERVFDICHGCRRCVSLCKSFPILFDLVDESPTFEVDGVDKADYKKVVDECYLCDLCYMTKCPYVPPHEWNVDFPHLMLRAKAIQFKKGETSLSHKILTSPQKGRRHCFKARRCLYCKLVKPEKIYQKDYSEIAGCSSRGFGPSISFQNIKQTFSRTRKSSRQSIQGGNLWYLLWRVQ